MLEVQSLPLEGEARRRAEAEAVQLREKLNALRSGQASEGEQA